MDYRYPDGKVSIGISFLVCTKFGADLGTHVKVETVGDAKRMALGVDLAGGCADLDVEYLVIVDVVRGTDLASLGILCTKIILRAQHIKFSMSWQMAGNIG